MHAGVNLMSLGSYGGPALPVVSPYSELPHSLHRLGTRMPHAVVTLTGHWLHLGPPDEFKRLWDRLPPGVGGAQG